MNRNLLKLLRVGAIGGAMFAATPALAQQTPETDIDALIDASASPDGALSTARGQVASGELLGAAATLEGALLANPGAVLVDVRLYYVSVLCRLDDRQRAQIELAKLGGAPLPDSGWAEVAQACGNITRPVDGAVGNRLNRIAVEVAAGVMYNSDAYGVVANQFDIPGFSLSDDGFSFVASAQIDGRAAIGDSTHVYYGLSALTNNSFSGPSIDYQYGTGRVGLGVQGSTIGASGGGVIRHGRIDGDPYFTEYGGQAEISALVARSGQVALVGELVHQDYIGSLPFFSRDGERYDVGLEYRGAPRQGLSYVLGGAYERKDAFTKYLGYQGWRGYAGLRAPIGADGMYTSLSAVVRHVNYRNVAFVADRVETRYFGRAALGIPLGLTGLDLEGAVSYTRRDYNAASFLRDYDNAGVELRLVYNFGK